MYIMLMVEMNCEYLFKENVDESVFLLNRHTVPCHEDLTKWRYISSHS